MRLIPPEPLDPWQNPGFRQKWLLISLILLGTLAGSTLWLAVTPWRTHGMGLTLMVSVLATSWLQQRENARQSLAELKEACSSQTSSTIRIHSIRKKLCLQLRRSQEFFPPSVAGTGILIPVILLDIPFPRLAGSLESILMTLSMAFALWIWLLPLPDPARTYEESLQQLEREAGFRQM